MRSWQLLVVAFGLLSACTAASPTPSLQREPQAAALRFVTTAQQDGPVAYRDPVGALSPDGKWIAYAGRGRLLRVHPIEGGAVQTLSTGERDVRYVTWMTDSRRIVTHERVFDRSTQPWHTYDRETGAHEPLWPEHDLTDVQHLTWSPTGDEVAGVRQTASGSQVTVWDSDGELLRRYATAPSLSFPAWHADGERLACVSRDEETSWLRVECAEPTTETEAYGPLGVSREAVLFGRPADDGFLELWARSIADGSMRRVSAFDRDTYAPSVADDTVLFKTQDYRVFVAVAPAGGGPSRPVTRFQSETPSWNWDSDRLAFTFGGWRHVVDDAQYPDIDQHLGTVRFLPGTTYDAPEVVVRQSYSEDQSLHWSPNGRWIAFHTHTGSDDIWLMPADGSGEAVQISEDGHETGWPRWSPAGDTVLYPSYHHDANGARHAQLYTIGVDQESGVVTRPQRVVTLDGYEDDVIQSDWANNGQDIVFESSPGFGRKELYVVNADGGTPRAFHQWESNQVHSGISVSHDSQWVAYIGPASDGHYQVFRVPLGGGEPEQLTFDPTDKTQPAYSPDGEWVAFTVFHYSVHFWTTQ